MVFDILTILPKMFSGFLESKILKRSLDAELFALNVHDIRAFSSDKHRMVDDVPFGGGPGMVMKPEPLVAALESVSKDLPSGSFRRIYLTPQGQTWNQEHAKRLLNYDRLIILCGRYRGVDQRVIDGWIDEEISIGDYITAGGEIPAMVLVESMARLIPGVLGNQDSLENETFSSPLPDAPQYTRPREFRGMQVPEVLLSGDHAAIDAWRKKEGEKRKKIRG